MKKGQKIGRLTTIQRYKGNPTKWLCKCDCGNEKMITECNLYTTIKSCGCLFKERFGQDRFTEEFIKNRSEINENDCWIWKRAKGKKGYGNVRYKGKTFLAHRLSWIIKNGEIKKGKNVCHKCDNPSCVNPSHLFLGTQKDNIIDAKNKGRMNPPKKPVQTKLNWDQVQEIKRLNNLGKSRKYLREKFNVSQTCIAKILTGKSWIINWTKEA